jgi:hypothetical protein
MKNNFAFYAYRLSAVKKHFLQLKQNFRMFIIITTNKIERQVQDMYLFLRRTAELSSVVWNVCVESGRTFLVCCRWVRLQEEASALWLSSHLPSPHHPLHQHQEAHGAPAVPCCTLTMPVSWERPVPWTKRPWRTWTSSPWWHQASQLRVPHPRRPRWRVLPRQGRLWVLERPIRGCSRIETDGEVPRWRGGIRCWTPWTWNTCSWELRPGVV